MTGAVGVAVAVLVGTAVEEDECSQEVSRIRQRRLVVYKRMVRFLNM
jgi:hypothetical protein